jgi:hypothetical protein
VNSRHQPESWIKSTYSQAQGECVEVAFTPDTVHTRDSKAPDRARLSFSGPAWLGFLANVREGQRTP